MTHNWQIKGNTATLPNLITVKVIEIDLQKTSPTMQRITKATTIALGFSKDGRDFECIILENNILPSFTKKEIAKMTASMMSSLGDQWKLS